jgi:hypothetical protein
VWCGSSSLKEAFPGLYNLACNKEASIADNHDLLSGSHQWNVSFLRSLNDWEVEDLVVFYSLLYSFTLGGGADKIWWVPSKKGKFEVRSFYNILTSNVSSLEEHLVYQSTAEGGLLCLVGCSWQDSHSGQLEEEKYGFDQ